MREVRHDGVSLATESFGDASAPPVLLVMGATASMLGWPDEFCQALAGRGLFVIRFDHRDTGQSTTVAPGKVRYAVEDMVGDGLAILDDYNIDRAHLVGMSLGGYIAQMVAVGHPARVASLTLIGSEPLGWDGTPLPTISDAFLAHFGALATLDWTDSRRVADFLLESERLCAGEARTFDEAREMRRIERVLTRTKSPASMFNHGALAARDNWTGRFRDIACPTLVIHGENDPILPLPNGQAIAQGIKGAALTVLPGIGHALPLPILDPLAQQIAMHIGMVR